MCSQALVLVGDFNHLLSVGRTIEQDIKQSRSFLECLNGNFLLQVIEKPTRRGAVLDLVLTKREGLVWDVKLKDSLGCRDHEMVFEILRAVRKGKASPGLQRRRLGLERSAWQSAVE